MAVLYFLHTLYFGLLNGVMLFVSLFYVSNINVFFYLIFVELSCILYRYFYSQFYPVRHLGGKIFCIFMEKVQLQFSLNNSPFECLLNTFSALHKIMFIYLLFRTKVEASIIFLKQRISY